MTEFIENAPPPAGPQDCELKAFYRLAERLKQRFPRLPICLLLDGLYAGGPTFARCHRYGWQALITLKDRDLPTVNEEFEALSKFEPGQGLQWVTGRHQEIHQAYRWVNDIAYVDAEQREHPVSVLECLETKPDPTGKGHTTKFKWVTSLSLTTFPTVGTFRLDVESPSLGFTEDGTPVKEIVTRHRTGVRAALNRLLGRSFGVWLNYLHLRRGDPEGKGDDDLLQLGANFVYPIGVSGRAVSAGAGLAYVKQDLGPTRPPGVPQDFWVANLQVGYELPNKLGVVVVGVENLFRQRFEGLSDPPGAKRDQRDPPEPPGAKPNQLRRFSTRRVTPTPPAVRIPPRELLSYVAQPGGQALDLPPPAVAP